MSGVSAGSRVAVTGVTGFVGQVLAQTLADRGYAVVGISNVATCPAGLSSKLAEYVPCDLTSTWLTSPPVTSVGTSMRGRTSRQSWKMWSRSRRAP